MELEKGVAVNKVSFGLLAVFVLSAVLCGCETVKGVGRDITNTGDAVERSISRR